MQSSRNLLLRSAAYDTSSTHTIPPIQKINTSESESERHRMSSITNTPGDNSGYRHNTDSSSDIYMTLVMDDQQQQLRKLYLIF